MTDFDRVAFLNEVNSKLFFLRCFVNVEPMLDDSFLAKSAARYKVPPIYLKLGEFVEAHYRVRTIFSTNLCFRSLQPENETRENSFVILLCLIVVRVLEPEQGYVYLRRQRCDTMDFIDWTNDTRRSCEQADAKLRSVRARKLMVFRLRQCRILHGSQYYRVSR